MPGKRTQSEAPESEQQENGNGKLETSIEDLKSAAQKYYRETGVPYSRFRSWEHCYLAFQRARVLKKGRELSCEEYDRLGNELAGYLASWGMYRGSTLLIRCDYKIHVAVARIVLREKYASLEGLEFDDLAKKMRLMGELYGELKAKFDEIRVVRGYSEEQEDADGSTDPGPTRTLVTKVLLGTLGCVLAFDNLATEGLNHSKDFKEINSGNVKTGNNFPEKEINSLEKLYKKGDFEILRNNFIFYGDVVQKYPPMKVRDMAFWKIGKKIKKQPKK